MLAVIYIRVSTEEQVKQGYSLEGQENVCLRKAKDLGAEPMVFRDEGITGAVLERPGLQEALQACKNPECQFFIVYDPDRLSRKLAHQLMLVDAIEKAGCRLEFVNFEWTNTPEGRLFYSLRGAVAEYEREKFKARSKFGKLTKARRGLLTHNPRIYGYRYVPGKSTLEAEEEKAAVYHYMVEMALKGQSPEKIAQTLNDEKIPGPGGGKWYRATVRRILKNYSYTGTLYLNKYAAEGIKTARSSGQPYSYKLRPREEWIPVSIPALITKEKWHTLQEVLERAKKGKRGSRVCRYLLSGLLFCGLCGSPMYGNCIKNLAGKRYRYYKCAQSCKKGGGKCGLPSINADPAERAVWSIVSTWLKDPEAMARELLDFNYTSTQERERKVWLEQLVKLNKEKERIFTAYRKGLVEIDNLKKASAEIDQQRRYIEKRIVEINEKLALSGETGGGPAEVKKLAARIIGELESLDDEGRSHLIKLLVRKITVLPGKNIVIEALIGNVYSGVK